MAIALVTAEATHTLAVDQAQRDMSLDAVQRQATIDAADQARDASVADAKATWSGALGSAGRAQLSHTYAQDTRANWETYDAAMNQAERDLVQSQITATDQKDRAWANSQQDSV